MVRTSPGVRLAPVSVTPERVAADAEPDVHVHLDVCVNHGLQPVLAVVENALLRDDDRFARVDEFAAFHLANELLQLTFVQPSVARVVGENGFGDVLVEDDGLHAVVATDKLGYLVGAEPFGVRVSGRAPRLLAGRVQGFRHHSVMPTNNGFRKCARSQSLVLLSSSRQKHSQMTGIFSCSMVPSQLAAVVRIANVRMISPTGSRQPPRFPPNASGLPSVRAMAYGCFPSCSRQPVANTGHGMLCL